MKILLALALTWVLTSCASQKKVMNSWLGNTKQHLIMKWGPPARTSSDGGEGEILIYSTPFAYYGNNYYRYHMFYVNNENKIYHWLIQTGQIPPQRLDMNVFIH